MSAGNALRGMESQCRTASEADRRPRELVAAVRKSGQDQNWNPSVPVCGHLNGIRSNVAGARGI